MIPHGREKSKIRADKPGTSQALNEEEAEQLQYSLLDWSESTGAELSTWAVISRFAAAEMSSPEHASEMKFESTEVTRILTLVRVGREDSKTAFLVQLTRSYTRP